MGGKSPNEYFLIIIRRVFFRTDFKKVNNFLAINEIFFMIARSFKNFLGSLKKETFSYFSEVVSCDFFRRPIFPVFFSAVRTCALIRD